MSSNGDLALEVQEAIIARLLGDPTLISKKYLDGPNVFDHIPDQQPPNFISISGATYQDAGDKTDPGQSGVFPVRVWTREKGDKLGLLIAKRITVLLHEQSIQLTAGQMPLIRFSSGGTVPSGDGVSRQVYRNFKIIVTDPSTE